MGKLYGQSCQFILKFGIHNNLGHNILEFHNVLVQIPLTPSKTKRDTYYGKLGIRVASQVAEQRKT